MYLKIEAENVLSPGVQMRMTYRQQSSWQDGAHIVGIGNGMTYIWYDMPFLYGL